MLKTEFSNSRTQDNALLALETLKWDSSTETISALRTRVTTLVSRAAITEFNGKRPYILKILPENIRRLVQRPSTAQQLWLKLEEAIATEESIGADKAATRDRDKTSSSSSKPQGDKKDMKDLTCYDSLIPSVPNYTSVRPTRPSASGPGFLKTLLDPTTKLEIRPWTRPGMVGALCPCGHHPPFGTLVIPATRKGIFLRIALITRTRRMMANGTSVARRKRPPRGRKTMFAIPTVGKVMFPVVPFHKICRLCARDSRTSLCFAIPIFLCLFEIYCGKSDTRSQKVVDTNASMRVKERVFSFINKLFGSQKTVKQILSLI